MILYAFKQIIGIKVKTLGNICKKACIVKTIYFIDEDLGKFNPVIFVKCFTKFCKIRGSLTELKSKSLVKLFI